MLNLISRIILKILKPTQLVGVGRFALARLRNVCACVLKFLAKRLLLGVLGFVLVNVFGFNLSAEAMKEGEQPDTPRTVEAINERARSLGVFRFEVASEIRAKLASDRAREVQNTLAGRVLRLALDAVLTPQILPENNAPGVDTKSNAPDVDIRVNHPAEDHKHSERERVSAKVGEVVRPESKESDGLRESVRGLERSHSQAQAELLQVREQLQEIRQRVNGSQVQVDERLGRVNALLEQADRPVVDAASEALNRERWQGEVREILREMNNDQRNLAREIRNNNSWSFGGMIYDFVGNIMIPVNVFGYSVSLPLQPLMVTGQVVGRIGLTVATKTVVPIHQGMVSAISPLDYFLGEGTAQAVVYQVEVTSLVTGALIVGSWAISAALSYYGSEPSSPLPSPENGGGELGEAIVEQVVSRESIYDLMSKTLNTPSEIVSYVPGQNYMGELFSQGWELLSSVAQHPDLVPTLNEAVVTGAQIVAEHPVETITTVVGAAAAGRVIRGVGWASSLAAKGFRNLMGNNVRPAANNIVNSAINKIESFTNRVVTWTAAGASGAAGAWVASSNNAVNQTKKIVTKAVSKGEDNATKVG